MTSLWLMFWLINDTPSPDFSGDWNVWAVSLVIFAFVDLMEALKA